MRQPSDQGGRHRTLTCVGFDWRAESSLKATLALLNGRTREGWEYSDDISADVVIYDPASALAQALVRNAQANNGRQIFIHSGNEDDDLGIRLPFGASRLVRCLDHASGLLSAGGQGSRPSAGTRDGLCQQLDEALQTPGIAGVELSANGVRGYLSIAEHQLYWPTPLTLDEAVRLMTADISLRAIPHQDRTLIQTLHAGNSSPVAWEGLLWSIGITTSGGQLLRRVDANRAYRLRRWPDFGFIGRRSADLKLTALLSQKHLTPTHLTVVSGVPATLVNGFMNACALCGLLDASEAPASVVRTTPGPAQWNVSGVFRRIREALAIQN